MCLSSSGKRCVKMIESLLILWNAALTIFLFVVIKCQINQEKLLFALRDDLNKAKICDGYVAQGMKNGQFKIDLSECPNVRRMDQDEK